MSTVTERMQQLALALYTWWSNSSRFFRTAVVILLALLLLVSGLLFQESDDVPAARNNLLVFFLIYINVIILCMLSFLIGRNVIKLIFDRKRGILGSRLQTRLVVAFAGIALVTNIILFIFAGGLLSSALESWFGEQVEDAVSGAVDVAKHHYSFLKEQVARESERVARRLRRSTENSAVAELTQKLEAERIEADLYGAVIVDRNQKVFAEAHNAASLVDTFSEPPFDKKAIARALAGKASVLFEEKESSQFIRGYIPVKINNEDQVLVTTLRIDAELTSALGLVNDSYKEYSQSKLYKNPLKAGYILTLLLITVVILFSAVWFGLYISKQITTPIIELSAATRRVARGDYETTLVSIGDDEMGSLAKSFNRMVSDLKSSRDDGEKRRLFIETILSRLAIGVIALDRDRTITSINHAAIGILGLQNVPDILGHALRTVIGDQIFEVIEPILAGVERDEQRELREADLTIPVEGSERKIVCTGGRLTESGGVWLGSLLLFDDVTELAKAQSMTVWREVAQRIAHEIKNPLTPIQLSAQRLQRLVTDKEKDGAVLDCAETIVQNVDLIKRLANEFSNFARMPTTEFRKAKLNDVLAEVVGLYAHSREDIEVRFVSDAFIPEMLVDTEQLKRVIINLIDNALDALSSSPPAGEKPAVVIKTAYDPVQKTAQIEVSDNGPGIVGADKIRIFEPYFTTKKGGTGIGLAIVLSIITDHQGTIRVFDNTPRGVKFVITLPVDQKLSTQRRLAV